MRPFIYITVLMLILSAGISFSQTVQWTQTYGDAGYDGAESMVLSNDGGLVMAGFKSQVAYGYKDILLMKTNDSGTILWSRIFNKNLNDIARSIKKTIDGGYIITGMTEVTPQIHDPFLLKTDSQGNMQWFYQYDYGFGRDDRAHAVFQTTDGGYIFAGQTSIQHGSFFNYDFYIMKADANGVMQWKKIFYRENEGNDVALGIEQLTDGGYIIGGFTQSSEWASFIIRTDNLGNAIWSNIYTGVWQSECYDIKQTSDGGFIFTGTESSYATDTDVLITKLNSGGTLLWKKIYGGVQADQGNCLSILPDGGYVVAGQTANGFGGYDMYVIRTNSNGDSSWSKIIGGTGDDRAHAVVYKPNNTFFVSGWSWSFSNGLDDVYLAKLSESIIAGINNNNSDPSEYKLSQNYPNPFNPVTKIRFNIPSQNAHVMLKIYDALGQHIETMINKNMQTGDYEVEWNAAKFTSGIYFYTLFVNGNVIDTKKMSLIK